MKRAISFFMILPIIFSVLTFGTVASDGEKDYMKYINDIEETVIEIDGISSKHTFIQIADSHIVNLSSNTGSFYYSESVSRYNHFINIGNGYPAKDTLRAMFEYAADSDNNIDGVWMSGDNIDFPSSENIGFLKDTLASNPVDIQYCFGNHDWTYPSHYFDDYARKNYRPLLTELMGGNNLISLRNYGDFLVVTIDNSENYIKYDSVWTQLNNAVISTGLPVILVCHVPFYNPELQAYCKSIWKTDETMNPNSTKYPNTDATKKIYNWVTSSGQVKAVISGHLHINYSGKLAGGVPQYCVNGAYSGTMRRITVKPTVCAVHTWDEGEVLKAPTVRPGQTLYTCTVCSETKIEETAPIYLYGDVSSDGKINLNDIVLMRRYLARAEGFTEEGQLYAADINEDGKINAKDSLLLRKYWLGLIDLPLTDK